MRFYHCKASVSWPGQPLPRIWARSGGPYWAAAISYLQLSVWNWLRLAETEGVKVYFKQTFIASAGPPPTSGCRGEERLGYRTSLLTVLHFTPLLCSALTPRRWPHITSYTSFVWISQSPVALLLKVLWWQERKFPLQSEQKNPRKL